MKLRSNRCGDGDRAVRFNGFGLDEGRRADMAGNSDVLNLTVGSRTHEVAGERLAYLDWRRVAVGYTLLMGALALLVSSTDRSVGDAAWRAAVVIPALVIAWGLRTHRPPSAKPWNALALSMGAFAVHSGITELLTHVVNDTVLRVLQVGTAATAVACGALAIGEITHARAHVVEFVSLLSAAALVEWLVVTRPDPAMALAPTPFRAALIALPVLIGLAAVAGASRRSLSVSSAEIGLLLWAGGFSADLLTNGVAGRLTRVGEMGALLLIGLAALSPEMSKGFGARVAPQSVRFGYIGAVLLTLNPFVAEMAYVGYQRRWLVIVGIASGAVGTALFAITAFGWAPLARRRPAAVPHQIRALGVHTGAAWLASQLRSPIDLTALEVHYQPVIRCRDGAVAGAEALVRARRVDGSLAQATEVIDLARLNGSLDQLDRFVLDQVMRDLPTVLAATDVDTPYVSVNLSPSRLESEQWISYLLDLTSAADIDTSALAIEVTESERVRDWERFSGAVARLQAAGIAVAMDDFGIGEANLSSLEQFDANVIKLDRALVRGIGVDPRSNTIAEMTAQLARNLNIRVIAEGIESPAMLKTLAHMGIEYAQGFAVGRPSPLGGGFWSSNRSRQAS